MRLLIELFKRLDGSNKTKDKLGALSWYFNEAQDRDAAWALWLLSGNKLSLGIGSRRLREWTEELTDYPAWIVNESYERVGDLAETVALLLPQEKEAGTDWKLHEVIEEKLLPIQFWGDRFQFTMMRDLWKPLTAEERFLVNKMITGGFRVGVSRTLLTRALAETLGMERSLLTHRLMGKWEPTESFFKSLKSTDQSPADHRSRPYPFYLASPIDKELEELEEPDDWLAEWKWDGIRAQFIKREGELYLWSRGEDLITDNYPELTTVAQASKLDWVIDGELLVWPKGEPHPRSFHDLQTRLGRKKLTPKILEDSPVRFLAYDCLEFAGEDLRNKELLERKEKLQQVLETLSQDAFQISETISAKSWEELRNLWEESRDRRVEGIMLKRKSSPYKDGRVKGDWWKWKIDPLSADLVLMYAQAGHGRRANLYTDYTLGAWDGDKLVPVAKAYSGLTDEELRTLDRWIKKNTLAKRGPVRTVPPEHVFEIGFEGIRESNRHKSGVAMRFPRILRWRNDKPTSQADSLTQLKDLISP